MSQNTIFKGRDTPVIINFVGVDLTGFTDISASFGSDTRTKQANPTSVIVNSATELELNFQDTTETDAKYWCIFGTDAINTNGVPLTSECQGNLPKSPICEAC